MNINPNKPRTEAQWKRILKYMREGNRITQREALEIFGCARLASRITDITDYTGIVPQRRMITVQTRDGFADVCQYWIETPREEN